MKRSPLTPTQKATMTGTFFVRAQLWTPKGTRIDLEMPWIPEGEGHQLLERLTLMCGAKHEKTNEEWETIALAELGKRKKARSK